MSSISVYHLSLVLFWLCQSLVNIWHKKVCFTLDESSLMILFCIIPSSKLGLKRFICYSVDILYKTARLATRWWFIVGVGWVGCWMLITARSFMFLPLVNCYRIVYFGIHRITDSPGLAKSRFNIQAVIALHCLCSECNIDLYKLVSNCNMPYVWLETQVGLQNIQLFLKAFNNVFYNFS